MAARGPLMDDLASLMTNAAGVAQGMRREAEVAFASYFERWLAEQDLPTREEVDTVREMARKAREENEALASRVKMLEGLLGESQEEEQENRGKPENSSGSPPQNGTDEVVG